MELRVSSLSKRFGARRVLDGVSLAVAGPGTTALLGENGSGKSTLLAILAGVLGADGGTATLDEQSLLAPAWAARRDLGYVAEAAAPFPHLTAGELRDLVCAIKRCAPPGDELTERLGVAPLLGQRIGSMSLGQRRRVCLLVALAGQPRLLLLDEPTNGLDPDGARLLADLLAEHAAAGGATLLATHDLAFAANVASRRLRLAAGRIAPEP